MQEFGLNTGSVRMIDGVDTGIAIIQVEEAGQNTIAVCAGANARWSAADIDAYAADIARAKITLLQREVPHEANLAVAKAARAAGGSVLLDPAPVGDASRMADLIALSDIISPNETEAAEITGIEPTDLASAEAAARNLLERGPKTVIVKLGSRGALLVTADEVKHFAPFKVQVVDTVAAGDSFNGGFAVAFSQGQPLHDCVRYGSAAGAIAVTRAGAGRLHRPPKKWRHFCKLRQNENPGHFAPVSLILSRKLRKTSCQTWRRSRENMVLAAFCGYFVI